MGDSPDPNIDLVKLRDLLLKHAVSDDLRNFCFELGETYENIVGPNDKLNTAVINVVTHFKNRERAGQLVERAKVAFPNGTWGDVFVAAKTIEISASSVGEAVVSIKPQVVQQRKPGPLRIFLCHASDDKPAVRDLYAKLKDADFDPWLDEEKLELGRKWRTEIPKAIQRSDVILVCVSKKSANKEGYVKREIEFALDIAEKQSDDSIFVIPVRLEDCDFPERVREFHGVSLFDSRGLERLTRALQTRAQTLRVSPSPADDIKIEIPRPVQSARDPLLIELPALNFRMELVRVPAGDFLMGGDKAKDKDARDSELPQHRVYLDEYLIGKYPVTNAHYQIYARAKRIDFTLPKGKEQHPVINVSWNDATAFCKWLSETTSRQVALPTEAQWEKAARWDAQKREARIWPWGNTFDKNKVNTYESSVGDTTPVGLYSPKGGDSPYGCADMAGNVWNWCSDWYGADEYKRRANQLTKNPEGPTSGDYRVLRGGSRYFSRGHARAASHGYYKVG